MDAKTIAQATYEKAQEAQRIARKNLDDQNTALADWKAKFEEAKKVLDASKPAIQILKAQLQKADADVTIARAELSKLAPEKVASGGNGPSQTDLCAAVARILATAAPDALTNDEIFNRLTVEGIAMGGTNPRSNLTAYIARWSKVPLSGIESAGRGLWKSAVPTPAEVPSFLAPPVVEEVKVPAFLAGVDESVKQDSDDAEDTSEPLALPEGFPGREALIEAGFDTQEKLSGKTHDQLRRIKGVGAATAKLILEALEA